MREKELFCMIMAIFTCVFFFALPGRAAETRPDLEADTYIDRDAPDSNFGGDSRLDCHYGITGTDPDGSMHYLIRQLLLRFDQADINAIPAGDEIEQAMLRLYLESGDGNSHVYLDLGLINTGWDESSVTWNSLGQRILYPRSPRITIHVGEDPGWYEWDITSIVNQWRSGSLTNNGISLDIYLEAGTPIEDYSRIFSSREGSGSLHAELVIVHEETVPPTDVDLSITKHEVTQTVQYLDDPVEADNSVPMIAHKPMIIRCYVDIGAAAGPVHNVSGRLYRQVGGIEESIAPLNPIVAQAVPDRENHHHTLNFRPPVEWLTGSWDYYIEINPGGAVVENDYTNNRYPAAGSFNVDFEAEDRELDIAWLKVHYTWSGWGGDAWAGDRVGWPVTVNFLRAVYPVAPQRLNYYHWPGSSLGDWDSDIDTDYSALLSDVDDLLSTSTLDPKPDILYGWIPDGAYSGKGRGYVPGNSAFGEDNSSPNMLHRIIFTHELGHNLDQAGHTALPADNLTGGEFGYDPTSVDLADRVVMRTFLDGGVSRDLRDFMLGGTSPGIFDGNHAWTTPYTYEDMHAEMASRGFVTGSASAPYGAVPTLYISGIIDFDGDGAATGGRLRPLYLFSDHVPDQSVDGKYRVELLKDSGELISRHTFQVRPATDYLGKLAERQPFSLFVPYNPEVRQVVLRHDVFDYDQVKASDNPPQVELLYPNGGESLSGRIKVLWKGGDRDGDELTYLLQYSPDGGTNWTTVASALAVEEYGLDLDLVPGSEKALLRVLASDNFHTAADVSDNPFLVKKKRPRAYIIHPDRELIFAPDHPMLFVGQGHDPEDGVTPGQGLSWSSDLDGYLGGGHTLETRLSVGIHTLTLTATDEEGNTGTDEITVHNLKGEVFLDKDNDGFGNPDASIVVFDIPEGYSGQGGDCDDGDALINPDASDWLRNDIDDDCDVMVDEDRAKWLQTPDTAMGVNLPSIFPDQYLIADNWLCTDGAPIDAVHFWGSYLDPNLGHWQGDNPGPLTELPATPGIGKLRITIYSNSPVGPNQPYPAPDKILAVYDFDGQDVRETYFGSFSRPVGEEGYWEHKFYYTVRLPAAFVQEAGTVYWLSIAALAADQKWIWGWESSDSHWDGNAVMLSDFWQELVPGTWPIPSWYPRDRVDMAFMMLPGEGVCEKADFSGDGDVDGGDLAFYARWYPATAKEVPLARFGEYFGTVSCGQEE